ncbi:glycosyltransferase [Pseudoalteromonas rubra]|uniref:glycosyltransferase n=1 Tax=Pseudoalteromonas rubra TaxID=43658 RepID=UPI0006970675|nr:glycosyltransferase [Pseudoalteromonas rubra]
MYRNRRLVKRQVMPSISVVIPTYNCWPLLEQTLQSLTQQSLEKYDFEVIVVDDGSKDSTEQCISSFSERLNLSYFYQDDLGYRVAKARNMGITHATGSVVLCLDAGMWAHDDLLKQHIELHKGGGDELVVLGLSYGVNEFCDANFALLQQVFDTHKDTTSLFDALFHIKALYDCRYTVVSEFTESGVDIVDPWVLCWSGHISCKKTRLQKINGFDPWFNSWGGEDVELGIRLAKAGCKFHYLTKQLAIHLPHPKEPAQKRATAIKNIEYICSKHPQDRYQMLQHAGWRDIIALQTKRFESRSVSELV